RSPGGRRDEGRAVLWRTRHSPARALRDDSQAAGECRLPADLVAPDALLRALRAQRFHPGARISRRLYPPVLPRLRPGPDERIRAGEWRQADRLAEARSR